jgi:spermidine/putrescine transport system substrate-binding protein
MSEASSTRATLLAARGFRRRTLLKSALYGGAFLSAGPFVMRHARGSQGELDLYTWSDYVYPEMIDAFLEQTGIRVNLSTYGSNDEVVNRLRASQGEGFDVVMPSITYGPVWTAHELLQPMDESRINVAGVIPSMWESSADLGGVHNGARILVPFNWGTEAMAIDTAQRDYKYGELSYGTLWEEENRGLVTVRAHSCLLGIGLFLDALGEVPSNRMRVTYENEDDMRAVYEQLVAFAIDHKPWILQFWSNAQETEAAFYQNGAAIGQTWDGPAMRMRSETGGRITYLAPKEGAMTWMDSIGMPTGARNIDQAYEWINWYYQPDNAAIHVRLAGYNSCTQGAAELAGEEYAENLAAAYPEDAIERLWWYPPEPTWFVAARNEFRDRFLSA